MTGKYILDKNKNPVLVESVYEWADWYEKADSLRRVAEDTIGDFWISTVFLALNHRFDESGAPVLFETMIQDKDEWLGYQERYCTWKEAEEGHQRAIEWVKNGCKEEDL